MTELQYMELWRLASSLHYNSRHAPWNSQDQYLSYGSVILVVPVRTIIANWKHLPIRPKQNQLFLSNFWLYKKLEFLTRLGIRILMEVGSLCVAILFTQRSFWQSQRSTSRWLEILSVRNKEHTQLKEDRRNVCPMIVCSAWKVWRLTSEIF